MNSVQSDAGMWVFSHCAMLPPVLILLLFLYDNMIRKGNPVGQPRPIFLGVPEASLTCTALPKCHTSLHIHKFVLFLSRRGFPQTGCPPMWQKRGLDLG